MNSIIKWAVRNTPAMNTLMVAIMIIGGIAAYMLRREAFPHFQLEFVLVTVAYPGASPDEVEEGICQKVEEAIRAINGIKTVRSVSSEGSGTVIAELEVSQRELPGVVNEIRSEVDRISTFPVDAEDPVIKQLTFRAPVIKVAVTGPEPKAGDELESELRLREVVEKMRDEMLALPDISVVEILAAKDYQIDVEISEETLKKHGMTLKQVSDAIRQENLEVPAGLMRTESDVYLVRGKNKSLVGEEIAAKPLLTRSDGVVLTIGDIGHVNDGFIDEEMVNRVNGKPAMVLQVEKAPNEDLLSIVNRIHTYIDQKQMPEGYQLTVWGDDSIMVQDRLNLLLENGTGGLILVFIILSLFLDIRIAFWVAMGIPMSLLGACAVLYFTGETMNMISMFAFVMALGIVVDDAIVVSENFMRHREMGKSSMEAAVDGTIEVAPSVAASVTTTVIAFIPMLFVAGVMGKFIAVMPAAIIAILIFSLFESQFVLPCHLSHVKPTTWGWFLWIRRHFEALLDGFIQRVYLPTLKWSLNNSFLTLSLGFCFLMTSAGLVVGGFTPFVVFPKLDSDQITAKVVFPNGTSTKVTDAATRRMEAVAQELIAEYADKGTPIAHLVYRSIGEVRGQQGSWEDKTGGHVGAVTLDLIPSDQRSVHSETITKEWRSRLGEFAGAEELSFYGPSMGPGGKAIEFKIVGDKMKEIEDAVDLVKTRLGSYPGVYDITDDSQPGKWELQMKIKPEAEALGIRTQDLANTIRGAYFGDEVMRLQRGRHEVKLMVRYPPEDRRSLANLDDIRVRAPDGKEIPLPELADVHMERGYSNILRIDQRRAITVSADLDENVANASQIVGDLKKHFMPTVFEKYPDLGVIWEGQQQRTDESVNSMILGFVVAMFAMFTLLTMEFRSYVQPMIVMVVIPFGMVGAILGHLMLGLPITMFSLFGMVALAGVVVNDSIVLIDFINARLATGIDLRTALVDSGRDRFRAILLTSVTTIGGLFPLLMERSIQAQVLIPMATSLCFGLGLSTIWVLIFVPNLYQVFARSFGSLFESTPDAWEKMLAQHTDSDLAPTK